MHVRFFSVGIAVVFILVSLSGCTENDEDKPSINKVPVAVITVKNENPVWWNDTLYVSAENSYDPDGNLTDYVWWFISKSENTNYRDGSRHGENVGYRLPVQKDPIWETFSSGNYEIDLMVVDNNGTVNFTSERMTIFPHPRITLEQKGTTHLLEIYVSDYNKMGFPVLKLDELRINRAYLDDEPWDYGIPGPTFDTLSESDFYHDVIYHDVDEDGNVSIGDTLDLDVLFESMDVGNVVRGSVVTIEITGGEWHNWQQILNPTTKELILS
jgi:hypothetical protein